LFENVTFLNSFALQVIFERMSMDLKSLKMFELVLAVMLAICIKGKYRNFGFSVEKYNKWIDQKSLADLQEKKAMHSNNEKCQTVSRNM
jgi:hypothetical protein